MAAQEPTPSRIIDKRKKPSGDKGLPAAEEESVAQPTPTSEPTGEFERQAADEAARRAAWDAMTEEEKQAVLAEQAAAETAGVPYSGGGVRTEGEQKKAVLAAFLVVIDLDGTALATHDLDTSTYEIQLDVTPAMMYRSCAAIMHDITVADTAGAVMSFMHHQAQAMAAQARAQALQQQLAGRGVPVGQPRRRG